MSCNGAIKDNKFVVTRGVDNTFIFTIKANNSTLPIEIDPSDTFTSILKDRATEAIVLTKPLMVESALNGQVKLAYTALETQTFISDRGAKEDRFYLRPVYSLLLVCNTVANGNFIARIDSLYVQ